MVLQRWQTLLLFVSLVLISIFSVSNYGTIYSQEANMVINASSNTGYWLYNLAIVLILLVSVFLFKKLNLQQTLVGIAVLMMGGTAIWGYNYLQILAGDGLVKLGFSWILLIVAFGLAIISFFCISADRKLLKSYDRLR